MAPWQTAWINHPNDALRFVIDVLGVPDRTPQSEDEEGIEEWQREALTVLSRGETRLSVRAGHGVGKTALEAWIVLWFMCTRYPFKIPITANSQDQLRDVVWSEIRKWAARLPEVIREQLDIQAERISWKAAPEAAFAVARTASRDNPVALQGFHEKNLLFVIEEASGIDDIVFEIARGALSTAGAIIVMFANPTRGEGYFYRSHHELADYWHTMRVSSEDVLRARGHIEEIIADYGRESNQYRVRVLGEFPLSESDKVMTLEMIDGAIKRIGSVDRIPGIAPVWGVDVGWKSDRSTLAKRCANELLEPVKWWVRKDPTQTALKVYEEWQNTEEEDRPAAIMVDANGIGAGTYSHLRSLGLPARAIMVSESAGADDKYMRLRDELWFKGRKWFEDRTSIMPNDRKLKAELLSPTYSMAPGGKIKVETKEEMIKRLGRSPDIADGFLLTFAGGEHKRQPKEKHKAYSRRKQPSGSWMSG